jgi:hypothetical protein
MPGNFLGKDRGHNPAGSRRILPSEQIPVGKKLPEGERECVLLDPERGMQPKDGKPCSPQDCRHYADCKSSGTNKTPKN